MSPKHRKPYKYRGTIVVDTNIIQHLFCEVPENRKADKEIFWNTKSQINEEDCKRIQHYLGVLEFLGKEGFHIVIPEMVAAETGSVLACGTDIIKHVGLTGKEIPRTYDAQLSKLLARVAGNRYPGIHIVEINEAKHPELFDPKAYTELLEEIKSMPKNSNDAKQALIALRQQVSKDLGEKAILGYIADTGQEGREDVFVLTEDKAAALKIMQESRVPVINFYGIMRPVISNGIHRLLGLKESVTAPEIMRDCVESRELRTRKKHHFHRRWVDMCAPNTDKKSEGNFRKAIDVLAEDLTIPNDWRKTAAEREGGRSPS